MEAWMLFEALKSLKGPPYTATRDEILRTTPDLQRRLSGYESDKAWRNIVHARILRGWIEKRGTYEAVLRDLNAEDVSAARNTAVGMYEIWNRYAERARDELGPDILPLCWEALLKYLDDLPEWQFVAFLRMVGAVPDPLSVEPLVEFLRDAPNYALRDAAARALAKIPRGASEARIRKELARCAETTRVLKDLLSDSL